MKPKTFTIADAELDAISEALRIAASALRELAESLEGCLPRTNAVEMFRQYAEQFDALRKRIEAR